MTEECYDCVMRFAVRIAEKTNQKEKINEIKKMIKDSPKDTTPAILVGNIWKFFVKDLRDKDIEKPEKIKMNHEVKKIIKNIETDNFSFKNFVELAIFGNLVDLYSGFPTDNRITTPDKIGPMLKTFLSETLSIDDTDQLEKLTKNATIFYLCDNSGEIGFDKLFIQKLLEKSKKIYVGVKDTPHSNDVIKDDALFFGLDKIAEIVEFPADGGFWVKSLKEKNKKIFEECGLIISKGQANFETLTEQKLDIPIAYLLRVKCPYLGRYLGVPHNSNVCWIKMP